MSNDAPWTTKRLLEWTADYFGRNDSSSPRLDAEVLLAHCLDCQRIDLYARFDHEPDPDVLDRYRSLVKQRANSVPVAYLVGYREFYSMMFEVSPAVLIPRPETEFLVIEAIDAAQELQSKGSHDLTIVDVGTGSGCVAITLAKHVENARIIGIDISTEALEIASRNAEKHKVADRIEWLQSDVLEKLDHEIEPDIIVSNPPYIGESERSTLMKDVVDHEPAIALFAEEDGMRVIRTLTSQSAELLKVDGHLLFEIGPKLADPVKDLLDQTDQLKFVGIRTDLDAHPRVVKARKIECP